MRGVMRRVVCLVVMLCLVMGLGGCAVRDEGPDLNLVDEGPDLSLLDEGLKIFKNINPDAPYKLWERGFMEAGEFIFDEYHLELLAYYRKAYEEYMLITLRLDLIDQKIEGSKMGFIPVENEEQTYYEKGTMLNLKYIYLRNDIHIERLSDNDLSLLEDLYAKNGSAITQEALDLVERTYPEVIKIYLPGVANKSDVRVSLDGGGGPSANPDSLIIAFINTDAINENGNSLDEEGWFKRFDYLKGYLPILQLELSVKLPVPVTLIITEGISVWYGVDDRGIQDQCPSIH